MPKGYTTRAKLPLPSFSFDSDGAVRPIRAKLVTPIVLSVVVTILVALLAFHFYQNKKKQTAAVAADKKKKKDEEDEKTRKKQAAADDKKKKKETERKKAKELSETKAALKQYQSCCKDACYWDWHDFCHDSKKCTEWAKEWCHKEVFGELAGVEAWCERKSKSHQCGPRPRLNAEASGDTQTVRRVGGKPCRGLAGNWEGTAARGHHQGMIYSIGRKCRGRFKSSSSYCKRKGWLSCKEKASDMLVEDFDVSVRGSRITLKGTTYRYDSDRKYNLDTISAVLDASRARFDGTSKDTANQTSDASFRRR